VTWQNESILHGIPASPGIAIGEVMLVGSFQASFTEPDNQTIAPALAEREVARFRHALDLTRVELHLMQKRLQQELDAREAGIFDAHLLIVDDQMLYREVVQAISTQYQAAEYAFYKVLNRYVNAIGTMSDDYIRQRTDDLKDVGSRVLSHLGGVNRHLLEHLPGKRIIVAHDLTPSATVQIDRNNVLGFAVETGSQTSHTAILARSMKIPAVVGIHDLCAQSADGGTIIIDGYVGAVIINPTATTIDLYRQKENSEEKLYADLLTESRLRPETRDGFCIQLAANVDSLEELHTARKFGAAGIGLFRTEYLFVHRDHLPTEEEQYNTYREMLGNMNGQPVTIRTIDAGGDKLGDTIAAMSEPNPFLGLRAIRLCLREHPELLHTQLRALLRASPAGRLKIMFPMISCVEEVVRLREMVETVKGELSQENRTFDKKVEVGIMIETPAAALQADTLAELVDFFSIGSNDLIQYTLAADRSNDKVAYLYQPTHPAVIELILRTADAGRAHNVWVSLCGEMAANPLYLPLLLGVGLNELSMSASALGNVRRAIRQLAMHDAEATVKAALAAKSAEDALECCREVLRRNVPEILDLATKGI